MKQNYLLLLAFTALCLLVLGIPVAQYYSAAVGVTMRWIGVAVGVLYFVLRHKTREDS